MNQEFDSLANARELIFEAWSRGIEINPPEEFRDQLLSCPLPSLTSKTDGRRLEVKEFQDLLAPLFTDPLPDADLRSMRLYEMEIEHLVKISEYLSQFSSEERKSLDLNKLQTRAHEALEKLNQGCLRYSVFYGEQTVGLDSVYERFLQLNILRFADASKHIEAVLAHPCQDALEQGAKFHQIARILSPFVETKFGPALTRDEIVPLVPQFAELACNEGVVALAKHFQSEGQTRFQYLTLDIRDFSILAALVADHRPELLPKLYEKIAAVIVDMIEVDKNNLAFDISSYKERRRPFVESGIPDSLKSLVELPKVELINLSHSKVDLTDWFEAVIESTIVLRAEGLPAAVKLGLPLDKCRLGMVADRILNEALQAQEGSNHSNIVETLSSVAEAGIPVDLEKFRTLIFRQFTTGHAIFHSRVAPLFDLGILSPDLAIEGLKSAPRIQGQVFDEILRRDPAKAGALLEIFQAMEPHSLRSSNAIELLRKIPSISPEQADAWQGLLSRVVKDETEFA